MTTDSERMGWAGTRSSYETRAGVERCERQLYLRAHRDNSGKEVKSWAGQTRSLHRQTHVTQPMRRRPHCPEPQAHPTPVPLFGVQSSEDNLAHPTSQYTRSKNPTEHNNQFVTTLKKIKKTLSLRLPRGPEIDFKVTLFG